VPFGGISQTFWRDILHSASGSKSSSNKKLTENCHLLLAYFLIGLPFIPEDGGSIIAQNVTGFLQNYTQL
jgi:hypothetical protein